MIPITSSIGSRQMKQSPVFSGLHPSPHSTTALAGSSNEIFRQPHPGQFITPFFAQTLKPTFKSSFISPTASPVVSDNFVPMATMQQSDKFGEAEARGSVQSLQEELRLRQRRDVSLQETKATNDAQLAISDLERELADTKSKESLLKDKLRDLRQDEIQDLKEQLAFHAKLNERARQMQSLKVSVLFLASKTSMITAEVFQTWRRVATDASREKLEEKLQFKLTKIRDATLRVFAGRSDASSLTYILQAWMKCISEERERKREKQIKVEALALKMQTSTTAKKLLLMMTQISSNDSSRFHFTQWRQYIFGIRRQEKTIVKAQEDTIAWRNRFDKVRNTQLRAILKWMGRSKCHIVIVLWKRAVEDAKSQRTAAEYKKEVTKLKMVSIPLMTAVIESECAKRWKAVSSARLMKTINTHAGMHFREKDEITVIRSFNAWKHCQKNTKHENSLSEMTTFIKRQSQSFDEQIIVTRSSMNNEIHARAEGHRLALQAEKDRAQETLTAISRRHSDKMETIQRQYQHQMTQAEETARKELHDSIAKLDEEMRQVKERGFAAEDKLKTEHRQEIAKLRDEHLRMKEQLVERGKKEQEENAALLNKRLAESSQALHELGAKAQQLGEESLITIADRDAARRELAMYQGEFRNLLLEFAQYKERADELEQVQKDDIVALEHFIENNIPSGSKFLLGRPVQIGDTKISKGHVVPVHHLQMPVVLGAVQSLRSNVATPPMSAPNFMQTRVPVHLRGNTGSSPRVDVRLAPPQMSARLFEQK